MAIVSCSECEKDVSDKAQSCPHCGAPGPSHTPSPKAVPKKKGGSSCLAMILFGIIVPSAVMTFGVLQSDKKTVDVDTPAGAVLHAEATDLALRKTVDTELSRQTAEWNERRAAAEAVLSKKTEDAVTGNTTHKPPKAPKYTNSITTVYGYYTTTENDPTPKPALKLNYAGKDWIFWDSLIIKSDDIRMDLRLGTPQRDHAGGTVGEVLSVGITYDENRYGLPLIAAPVVAAIATAKTTTIRFSGKYSHDHKLKSWERDSIQAALTLGSPPPTRLDAAAVVAAQTSDSTEDGPPKEAP